MAVTFTSIPNDCTTAGNPMVYVFSSNQTSQPNFSFIVETLLDGVVIAIDKVFPEVGNVAHRDVSENVQRKLQQQVVTQFLYAKSTHVAQVVVRVTENYGLTPINHDQASSTMIRAFNGVITNLEWTTFSAIATFKDKRFFTDNPSKEFLITKNCDVPISRLEDQGFQINIYTYDSNDVLLNSYDFQQVDTSYVIVNMNFKSSILETNDIDLTNVAYFKVQMYQGETLTFRYVEPCNDVYSLVWMNRYGCYEGYTFTHNITKQTEITDQSFDRQFGGWNGSNFVFDPYNSGLQSFVKVMQDSGEIISGALKYEVANWLNSVNESPKVFLYKNGVKWQPITITTSKVVELQDRFDDDVAQVIVEFDLGYKRKSVML